MKSLERSHSISDLVHLAGSASVESGQSDLEARVQKLVDEIKALFDRLIAIQRRLPDGLKQQIRQAASRNGVEKIKRVIESVYPNRATDDLARSVKRSIHSPQAEREFPEIEVVNGCRTLYVALPEEEKGKGAFKRAVGAVGLSFSGVEMQGGRKVQLSKNVAPKRQTLRQMFDSDNRKLSDLHARVGDARIVGPHELVLGRGNDAIAFMADEGESLEKARESLETEGKLQVLLDSAEALQKVHEANFVWCDIKLENIFVKDERAKLADPILKTADEAQNGVLDPATGKRTTTVAGTARIHPPEFNNEETKRNSFKSDVYALAMSAYRLIDPEDKYPAILYVKNRKALERVRGKLIERAAQEWDTPENREHIFGEHPHRPEGMNETSYEDWTALIMHGIHPDPEQRATAAEFSQALRDLLES